MTDDLKDKLEQLVADPPPPSAVPSQAVFTRVRKARRRRAVGAMTLAAAAVVAVAVAVTNVTDIDGRPPVSNTPSVVITPTTTTPTAPRTQSTSTAPSTQVTGAVHTPSSTNTNTPPPATTSNPPALGVHVTLKPTVKGRTVTMKVTLSGASLVPVDDTGKPLSTSGIDFLDLLGGTQYFFGDGQQSGSDAGGVKCVSGSPRTTGHQTYTLMNDGTGTNGTGTHTYPNAGSYTFKYTVKYCSKSGWVPVTKSTQVTIK
ncbi:hypothetical protein GCM10009630_28840 [Kribbella jejuensis]|uniref:Uncharacterized protein n=1 Tax=Kribbella jejuensis TaxID=236068 RepID=A0A542EPV5_9ACTN|nr:hypothetical protein [Kribbella jejuensis]TQJ17387.1 hypothetical protein FB475_1505 [Kribbella jejuensis]